MSKESSFFDQDANTVLDLNYTQYTILCIGGNRTLLLLVCAVMREHGR